jgi:hypothetical protein
MPASARGAGVADENRRLVRESLVVNGRPGPRGWQVRLSLSFDPELGDHLWLGVLTLPSRPGSVNGVWLVPLAALRSAVSERVSAGAVTLHPVVDEGRLFVEALSGGRPWTVSVPLPWVQRYLEQVESAT